MVIGTDCTGSCKSNQLPCDHDHNSSAFINWQLKTEINVMKVGITINILLTSVVTSTGAGSSMLFKSSISYKNKVLFDLWCWTPFSTIFHLYHGGQFCLWRKLEYLGENHRPAASHWQTLSHNVVLSTPRLSRFQTHNVSGDRHWLHRQL
jgi:hypothetical protein